MIWDHDSPPKDWLDWQTTLANHLHGCRHYGNQDYPLAHLLVLVVVHLPKRVQERLAVVLSDNGCKVMYAVG